MDAGRKRVSRLDSKSSYNSTAHSMRNRQYSKDAYAIPLPSIHKGKRCYFPMGQGDCATPQEFIASQTHHVRRNRAETTPVTCEIKNHSNFVRETGTIISPVNLPEIALKSSSVGVQHNLITNTNAKSIHTHRSQTDALVSRDDACEDASDSKKQTSLTDSLSARSRFSDLWEDPAFRDHYLSAVENMLKKHREWAGRSVRHTLGASLGISSSVPSRRIQMLTSLPEDPIAKLTGQHVLHAMGFKMPEKSDSLCVEPDLEMINQVNLLRTCEDMLANMEADEPQKDLTELQKVLENVRCTKARFSAIPKIEVTNTENTDYSSDLDSLSSCCSTPVDQVLEDIANKSHTSFNFDPVVQVHPSQRCWSTRKKGVDDLAVERIADLGGAAKNLDPNQRFGNAYPLVRAASFDALGMAQRLRSLLGLSSTKESSDRTTLQSLSAVESNEESVDTEQSFEISALACSRRWRSTDDGLDVNSYLRDCWSISNMEQPVVESHETTPSLKQSIIFPNVKKGDSMSILRIREPLASTINSMPISKGGKTSKQTPHGLCQDVLKAMNDPNPMAWFEMLEDRVHRYKYKRSLRQKMMERFRMKGLKRLFSKFPTGMTGLQKELELGWDIRPKPELLMNCVVRNHILKMPLTGVHDPVLLERIYTNTILRHPLLYKMIIRRREILPQDLQFFINRIMELTETSERMMSSLSASSSKLVSIAAAANEMNASGLMAGGPRLNSSSEGHEPASVNIQNIQSINSRNTQTSVNEEPFDSNIGVPPAFKQEASKHTSLFGKHAEIDTSLYISLRNPSSDILEEVAFHLPEFAWHIRPLFECRWASLENELYMKLVNQNKIKDVEYGGTVLVSNNLKSLTSRLLNQQKIKSHGKNNNCDKPIAELASSSETVNFCLLLLRNVLHYFSKLDNDDLSSEQLTNLMICLHMSNYYPPLADALVKDFDIWIPPLLTGIESRFSVIREETCCVIAYLVCSYRLMMRLHVVSKNLLVANITLCTLSAIGHFPESYAFYHGLLGYMLHSLPCLSILDCLLLWLPSVLHDETNLISRDWALFVYYVLRHWPRNPFHLDPVYQKKLLKPLEVSFLTRHAKRSARLALSYLVRTCHVRSALLTCWPDKDDTSSE